MSLWDNVKKFAQPYSDDDYDDYDEDEEYDEYEEPKQAPRRTRRAAAPGHAHTASITCSSAAESGRRVSGKPYICCTSVNV